jgi:hypothetical protein
MDTALDPQFGLLCGSSEKCLPGVMQAIEFKNEVTLVAQPIGLARVGDEIVKIRQR